MDRNITPAETRAEAVVVAVSNLADTTGPWAPEAVDDALTAAEALVEALSAHVPSGQAARTVAALAALRVRLEQPDPGTDALRAFVNDPGPVRSGTATAAAALPPRAPAMRPRGLSPAQELRAFLGADAAPAVSPGTALLGSLPAQDSRRRALGLGPGARSVLSALPGAAGT
ncbi:hypothetical protein ACIO3O_36930 [Streptomyces sp. NPDC087440]|uniref:hypothetical protein n=1 Tax=Streptomyces sp. NPDC087440 TaxID=3365790 RepID=UPI003830E1D8